MLHDDRPCAPVPLCAALCAAIACAPGAESPTVETAVRVGAGAGEAFVDDAGWSVQLTTCRAAISDLRFTTGGEVHERGWVGALRRLAIADAWAHPGHAGGGDVIGELPGRQIVDWCGAPGVELGRAKLTLGEYSGGEFVFVRGAEADGLEADDPLIGYSLEIGGEAVLDGRSVEFYARILQDEGREVIGLPMDAVVEGDVAIGLELGLLGERLLEEIEFDGVAEGDSTVVEFTSGDENYNRLLRAAQSHEAYAVYTVDAEL